VKATCAEVAKFADVVKAKDATPVDVEPNPENAEPRLGSAEPENPGSEVSPNAVAAKRRHVGKANVGKARAARVNVATVRVADDGEGIGCHSAV
jgi:hypothetical protein